MLREKNIHKKILVLSFVFGIIFLFYIIKNLAQAQHNKICFYDPFFNIFKNTNHFLKENKNLKNIILSFNGIIIDFMNLFFLSYYYIWNPKFIIGPYILGIFYLTRSLVMQLFKIPIPGNTIFSYPHFPSILVDYNKTNDYYFSGHTGNMLFYLLASYYMKNNGLFYFSIFSFVYTILMLIIYQAHYSIDILIAILNLLSIFYIFKKREYKILYYHLKIYNNILQFLSQYFNIKTKENNNNSINKEII